MSEPIPESIPTSADRRSQRPTKKRALTPSSAQADQVEALFVRPDREITLPGDPKPRTVNAPPEIVANVQGSSAGAGSGEFHVYKASRRREYERLRAMDEETAKEEEDKAYAEKQGALRKHDEEKLSKNRVKREKAKMRKQKAGKGGVAEGSMEMDAWDGKGEAGTGVRKGPGPAKVAVTLYGVGAEAEVANGSGQAAKGQEEAGIIIHDDD